MLQSQLFTRTRKEAPTDEVSKNAKLLIRAGFIHNEMAGVYSFLPLGLRVLKNIENIIREEMSMIGGQELFLTVLQDPNLWSKSGRWQDDVVDNWFKTKLKGGKDIGLAFTHEEPIANIMKNFVNSYKDLPFYAYQIQTKFRNEERAKSGLIRGREFLMKDLYSFSRNEEDHNIFYERMKDVYMDIFERLGIRENTYLTASNGQPFSKYSFEFQTVSEAGEDVIVIDEKKKIAINKKDFNDEIVKDLALDGFEVSSEEKSIEVGDIYSLGYKYSDSLGLKYKNEKGEEQSVYMGSYGMSPTRLMGTIAEVLSDEKGLIWPVSVAPFKVHIVTLDGHQDILSQAKELKKALELEGLSVLWDDRNIGPGEKFADSDLLGIPLRVVLSPKTMEAGNIEIKNRTEEKTSYITEQEAFSGKIKEIISQM